MTSQPKELATPRTCPAHFAMHDVSCTKGCGDICIAANPERVNRENAELRRQLEEVENRAETAERQLAGERVRHQQPVSYESTHSNMVHYQNETNRLTLALTERDKERSALESLSSCISANCDGKWFGEPTSDRPLPNIEGYIEHLEDRLDEERAKRRDLESSIADLSCPNLKLLLKDRDAALAAAASIQEMCANVKITDPAGCEVGLEPCFIAAIRSPSIDIAQGREILEQYQAKIDALMLEYCPDEMTPEQVANWQAHQQAVTKEETAAIDAALASGVAK